MQSLTTELNDDIVAGLTAGNWVELSGELIVMRDAAHKRLLSSGDPVAELPVSLEGKIVFYAGPTAGLIEGNGVIGPTTSARMDRFVEPMLNLGIRGFLGKGPRRSEVTKLLVKYKSVYFITIGGAAAYLAKFVKEAKVIAYDDLGPEAVYLITVQNFPAIIGIDAKGMSIWHKGGSQI